MKWTPEQQKVIELRDRNILVSAAAGSGKTAVLVERILGKLTRKDHPIDIDQLLIVTFTRAAAGEMRERLTEAVENYLEQDPENEHLQRQQTLIHNAQITTIDGFCSYVIRNYFHTIDLDPGFRTANEGEIKLLKQDVAKEVLESSYQERTESFDRFVESFATGKSDEVLMELILRMYEFAMSNPWPLEWLDSCTKAYEIRTKEELVSCIWMKKLWEDAGHLLDQITYLQERCKEVIYSPGGPYMYGEALEQDLLFRRDLEEAFATQDFDGCRVLLDSWKPKALSRKKDDSVQEDKRELAKNLRDQAKDAVKKLRENYFYETTEEVLEELELCREPVQELIRLTRQFIETFSEKKRQKNIVDFTDMEHFALEILVKKEDGEIRYTQAADEFSDRFEEILIDEYQDSNLVQETLLQSVSQLRFGRHNLFMVGDVKQSIYRFRLARPELFMEKYETYSLEDSVCQRIDLHKNFRSRAGVLEGVNQIFYRIMGKDLGAVEYDADAALYPGAVFEEKPEGVPEEPACQVLVAQTGTDGMDEKMQEQSDQELEARMIGEKIRSMVGTELVWDKKEKQYRPARYQDCVILLRTITGWAENFVNVLMDMGIPAYATSKTGYFSTTEVQTILNYLRILDNPMQEIPFTGVLLSPLGGCSARELALLKACYPQEKIYGCVWNYLQEGQDGELCEKLGNFWSVYEKLREKVTYTPIHELIGEILAKTGYGLYAGAMPGGAQRRANLQMLVEKAMEYESTSYRGLFHFVRYIENLQKYEVDFGEAGTIGEEEDTVRIMSIHKSKGLEFPVVFAAGLGKNFNRQDSRGALAVHQKYGVGCDWVEPKLRMKTPTLLKKVIQRELALENTGEELRVLYVALTRAKEKLYLTGSLKKIEEKLEKWGAEEEKPRLSFLETSTASCALEWVLRSVLHTKMPITVFQVNDLLREDTEERQFGIRQKEWILEGSWRQEEGQKEVAAWLTQTAGKRYPFEACLDIQGKLSVSELKRRSQKEDGSEGTLLYPESVPVPLIPIFIEKHEESGTVRGTAMHHIMQKLDFTCSDTIEKVRRQLEALTCAGTLTQEECTLADIPAIVRFFGTNLGVRAAAAAERGELYREKQFVIGIPAAEILPEWEGGELVLVQGIIDIWFYEDGAIVLADYKTDRIAKGQEELLVKRYKAQLDYYGRALEQMTGKQVKEKLIYSFALRKSIAV